MLETVEIRGRTRTVVRPVARPPRLGRRRYAVVYDVDGPRVRLGLLWFAAVVGSIVVGRPVTALLYAAVAAVAARQVADAWAGEGSGAHRWVAPGAAAAIGGSALFGPGLLGLVLVVVTVTAVLVAGLERHPATDLAEAAGTTVQSALFAGMAAAGVVLTFRFEVGAVVVLVLAVAAYEIGDYIVGSGASNAIEGPVAGIVGVVALTFVVAVARVPPWDGPDVWAWGALAAVGCPAGQLLASAILPRAEAPAWALRRLDSLLLVAPVWAWTVGLYLDRLPVG